MELYRNREIKTPNSTCGSLYFVTGDPRNNDNYEFICYILEPEINVAYFNGTGPKIKGHTAIKAGRYQLVEHDPIHFSYITPLYVGVPDFADVLFHKGNFQGDAAKGEERDSTGCSICGTTRKTDYVGDSKDAFDLLMNNYIFPAWRKSEGVWVTVSDSDD